MLVNNSFSVLSDNDSVDGHSDSDSDILDNSGQPFEENVVSFSGSFDMVEGGGTPHEDPC